MKPVRKGEEGLLDTSANDEETPSVEGSAANNVSEVFFTPPEVLSVILHTVDVVEPEKKPKSKWLEKQMNRRGWRK